MLGTQLLMGLQYNAAFSQRFGSLPLPLHWLVFENTATLDNNDFFGNRQDCRITFLPGGRHSGDRSPDQNTPDLHPHMGEAFVDMMGPLARYRPISSWPGIPASCPSQKLKHIGMPAARGEPQVPSALASLNGCSHAPGESRAITMMGSGVSSGPF
jgi:hypothetical protein